MNIVININTLKWNIIDITFSTYNTIICIVLSIYYNLNICKYCILIIGIIFIHYHI